MEQPQLLTRLEPELLRGVSLHECLSGFGRHWRKPDPGMSNINPHDYDLSHPMEYFDDFLSHDWGTSRFLKLASMLIIYNSRAALLAMLMAAIMLAAIQSSYRRECISTVFPMDQRLIAVGICHGIHIFVLCFWQRLRSLLLTPRFVFLDKLCIAQSPELADLKTKGILGLAAFLNHSRRLVAPWLIGMPLSFDTLVCFCYVYLLMSVFIPLSSKVLWSPRYFQRLWCSYEIATFLADGKQQKPLVVMPAHAGLILVLSYATWSAVTTALWCVLHAWHSDQWGMKSELNDAYIQVLIGIGAACLLVAFVGIPLISWVIALARTVQETLQEQLHTFRIQETLCFCCSNQHRHPDTGAVIPCDRELVYLKLKEWYGHPNDMGEESLTRFNLLVQTRLASSILSSMSNLIPRRYQFYMIAATNMPWLCETLVNILSGCGANDTRLILQWLLEWITISMVMLLGSFWATFIALHLGVPLARYMPRLFAAALVFPVSAIPVAIFLGSFYYLTVADPTGFLFTVPSSLLLIVIMCYSCHSLCQSQVEDASSKAEIEIEATSSGGNAAVGSPPSPSSSCWST